MFTSWASFFATRQTSIKGQKLVSEVVKHHDKQNGLVQVRTRGLHDDWPEEALPWMQMKGGFGSGNNGGTTNPTEQIPPVGSKVWTQFEDNSQYHGQYFGGAASDDKKLEPFTGDNYGKAYGHADIAGNLKRTGTEEGKEYIEEVHVKGTNYKMDENGNFNIAATKALNFESQDGGTIKVKGKLVLEADEIEFKHKGAKSTMPIQTGGGSPSAPNAPKSRSRPVFKKPGPRV